MKIAFTFGSGARAVALAREAVEGIALLAGGLSEGQGGGLREGFSDVYDVGARAAASLAAVGDVSYFLESGRAGAFLESGGQVVIEAESFSQNIVRGGKTWTSTTTACSAAA